MWREDKTERAKRGHERRQGQSTMPLLVKKIDMTTIRVTDTESGGWSEWDISAWRVRRINEFDPANSDQRTPDPVTESRAQRAYDILVSGQPPFSEWECKASYALSRTPGLRIDALNSERIGSMSDVKHTALEAELLKALQYIAKQWPDSFAARHARAAIAEHAKASGETP